MKKENNGWRIKCSHRRRGGVESQPLSASSLAAKPSLAETMEK
jgi:hypothetical protein